MQAISDKAIKVAQKFGYDHTAYIFWVIASILWNVSFIYPSEHKIGPLATNLSRGLGMVFLNSIGLYWRDFISSQPSTHKALGKKDAALLFIRHVILALYGFGFAGSQFYLPSPVLYTIYFSGPLFVMILQYFMYGVILTSRQFKGVIFTGIGVFFTANGQLIWAWITNDDSFYTTFKHYKTDSLLIKSFVALLMIALTFGWAYTIIIVRKVQGYSHWTLNFNYGVVMTIVSALFYSDKVIQQNPILFIHLFLKQGLLTAVGQLFFMSALLITKKYGEVTMIGFVSVVFSYFLSIFRYHQPINLLCVSGSIVALLGIYHIVIKQTNNI